MSPTLFLVIGATLISLGGVIVLVRNAWLKQQIRARLLADEAADPFQSPADESRGWFARWLYLAGYRQPWAPVYFFVATLILVTASPEGM